MFYSNFSLTSLCGGRNDLSAFFNQTNSTNTRRRRKRATDDDSLINFDWNGLATSLLSYKESRICQQSYVTGSGNIMQIQTVNRTCRCVLFDQVLNSNKILKQFATILRPIIYGKIYYHPSNIHYDNIIKKVNQTFEALDELVQLFRPMESTLQSSYHMFELFCHGFPNLFSYCKQLMEYKTSISLFTILTEYIACSERNRFIPMNSESDMVQAGQNNSVTNNFLAAIEFMDDITNNDSLPKHIRFKIRMTLDYVDNTFQTQDR